MKLIALVMLATGIAGCASVYIINASPSANMERGEGPEPFGASVKVDRKMPPPQPTTSDTR